MPPPRRPTVRPAPDLLARPAVCGHPTSMILTRAPSRAPFALVVKITPGPQTCSRAPVGAPASTLRFDHRLALAFASGWLVHRTSHRQAAATGAALSPPRPLSNLDKLRARQKSRALLTFLPRTLSSHNNAYPPNEVSRHMRALCGVQIHRVLFWLGAAEGAERWAAQQKPVFAATFLRVLPLRPSRTFALAMRMSMM